MKHFFLLLILLIMPLGYSDDTKKSLSDEEFNEAWKNEDYKTIFGENGGADRAWLELEKDPNNLKGNTNLLIEVSKPKYAEKFINFIKQDYFEAENNIGNPAGGLLKDPEVKKYYEIAIQADATLASYHGETFNRYLIENWNVNGYEEGVTIKNFEIDGENRILTFTSPKGTIITNAQYLNGATIGKESISFANGEELVQGKITNGFGISRTVESVDENNPAIAIVKSKRFIGKKFTFGLSNNNEHFVESGIEESTNSEGKVETKVIPIHFDNYKRSIIGSIAISENGDMNLGKNSLLNTHTIEDESNPSKSQKSFRSYTATNGLTISEKTCKGIENCLLEKPGVLSIEVKGSTRVSVNLYTNEKTKVQVGVIPNENSHVIINSLYSDEKVTYEVNSKEIKQAGFLRPENNLHFYGFTINDGTVLQHFAGNVREFDPTKCISNTICYTGYKPALIGYGTNEWHVPDNINKVKINMDKYAKKLTELGYTPIFMLPVEQDPKTTSSRLKKIDEVRKAMLKHAEDKRYLIIQTSKEDAAGDKFHPNYARYKQIRDEYPNAIAFGDSTAVGIVADSPYAAVDAFAEHPTNSLNTDLLIQLIPRNKDLQRVQLDPYEFAQDEISLADLNAIFEEAYALQSGEQLFPRPRFRPQGLGESGNGENVASSVRVDGTGTVTLDNSKPTNRVTVNLGDATDTSKYASDIQKLIGANPDASVFSSGSIVNGLASLGIRSDLGFRTELYSLLVPDGASTPGTANFNTELIQAIVNNDITSETPVTRVTGETTNPAPLETSHSRLSHCELNVPCDIRNNAGTGSTYTRLGTNLFCHIDKSCFDGTGDRINKEGVYVYGPYNAPIPCEDQSKACDFSNYKNVEGVWGTKNSVPDSRSLASSDDNGAEDSQSDNNAQPDESQSNSNPNSFSDTWKPKECVIDNGVEKCYVGRYLYATLADGSFLAEDSERFDPKGALIDGDGNYIDRNNQPCPENKPCAYSSQRAYFEAKNDVPTKVFVRHSTSFNPQNDIVNYVYNKEGYGEEFFNRIDEMAVKLKTDPGIIFEIMRFESGVKDPFSTGIHANKAVGLLSFTDIALKELNKQTVRADLFKKFGVSYPEELSKKKLAAMSGVEQLDIVEAYFLNTIGSRTPENGVSRNKREMYFAVLAPTHIRADASELVYEGVEASNQASFFRTLIGYKQDENGNEIEDDNGNKIPIYEVRKSVVTREIEKRLRPEVYTRGRRLIALANEDKYLNSI